MSNSVPSKHIQCLNLTGNLAVNWKIFIKAYNQHEKAHNIVKLPENEKIQFFLNAIGEESCSIYNCLTPYQRCNYGMVIAAYEHHCLPKKSVMLQRSIFHKRKQQHNEFFDEFYFDLQGMALTCDFGCDEEKMIREQIIHGLHEKRLKRRLQRYNNMQLASVVQLCREWEHVQLQMFINRKGCLDYWTVFCNCCK